MQISALVVQEVGAPFTRADVDLAAPAADEVLVKIAGGRAFGERTGLSLPRSY